MEVRIPDYALVVLIGSSGSGKSTFAARHFTPTEILSSDRCRGWVSDDETDQSATKDAFEVLHFIAGKRLAGRRLAVVDATNVRSEDRKHLVELARKYHALPVAIVLDPPEEICIERNKSRPDRQFGAQVVRNHVRLLRKSLRGLQREGFRHVFTLSSVDAIEAAEIIRDPLYTDRRGEHGPFDIIGDVHGCYDELCALLDHLGYVSTEHDGRRMRVHRDGRRVIFVGDLVDRGPNSPDVLRLAMEMVATGTALCVQGNHEQRLLRKFNGRDVKLTHGLPETLAQIEALPETERALFVAEARSFIDGLRSHFWLDDGKLVVAHAGLKEEMHGRGSGAVRAFALYGETTGETDEFGLPVRFDWAAQYRGKAMVVYGHVPMPLAEWVNRTICIDTGCVFGGKLTALRYPELDIVDVPAARVYCEPVRPLTLAPTDRTAQQAADMMLDLEDVLGKRTITTSLMGHVRIEAENAAAALEVISRFSVDPRWLIYLPPTMSPPETSKRDGLLEHPEDAFAFFERAGIGSIVAEEKHMGSRAVFVVARNEAAARRRFGTEDGRSGRIYTRTGRPFFNDDALERALLERLGAALTRTGFWEKYATEWVCLDTELLPWSAKAQALIAGQYRPVGIAGSAATNAAAEIVAEAVGRGTDAAPLLERLKMRAENAEAYIRAYERYVWAVAGIDDLKIAPFHLMATEGAVHIDRSHAWHMENLAEICAGDANLLIVTPHRTVDLTDPSARDAAIAWWEELTGRGGEGIVVKPHAFIAKGRRGLLQPALKCRGREYLRIIYGPDYTMPEHIERLRERGLGGKRALALREFALGIEALQRFIRGEPLRRVHECVFGVLALESEPIDPRL
jgi:protein phosphatase